MNGYPAAFGELAVDLTDQQLDFAPEFLIVWNFLPAGHDDLQQSDTMTQLGITPEQNSKSLQALWNTLCVVHTIHAKHQEFVVQFVAELVCARFYLMTGSVVC